MLTNQVLRGEITSLTPLMKGVRNSNNVVRIPLMAYLYRTLGPSRFVKGCNMAFWRSDLIRVNGYDEEFRGWGGEDSELATRLNNSGVRQRCMKFRGIVFHLYHGKCDRDRQSANEERYKQSLFEHRTRCRCGLDRHLPASERIVYTNTETARPRRRRQLTEFRQFSDSICLFQSSPPSTIQRNTSMNASEAFSRRA